ncbi:leucine-rich repeat protein [Candidatus Methanarcanum hacksteinii]|uniref:leucine-rich repeat protein n=1 Tax=Candidatus Methanarcanum hacksteinii TaxID=2911857 RepID=UPI0037DD4796
MEGTNILMMIKANVLDGEGKPINGNIVNMKLKVVSKQDVGSTTYPDYLTVVFPSSLRYIGDQAFNRAYDVTLPENSILEYIGDYSLSGAYSKINLPKTVNHIGVAALNPHARISISDENPTYSIDRGNLTMDSGETLVAYYGNETDYVFSEGIKKVSERAFYQNTTIKNLSIPDGVEWDWFPFADMQVLNSVSFAQTMDSIPDYLLAYTPIKTVEIPSRIVTIGEKAFYHTSLESVQFEGESRLSTIGQYAFCYNKGLTEISFVSHSPGYGCEISDGAFFYCNNLKNVVVGDNFNITSIGTGAFAKYNPNSKANDPSSFEKYVAISFGDKDSKCIKIGRGVEYVGTGAFSSALNISSRDVEPGANTLPSSSRWAYINADGYSIKFEKDSDVQSIHHNAFHGLVGVEEIDLSECKKLNEIGNAAFSHSFSKSVATDIKLPMDGSLVTIGKSAFESRYIYSHSSSEKIVPKSIQSIEDYAFYGIVDKIIFDVNSELRYYGKFVVSPGSITDMTNCSKLKNVIISNKTLLPQGVYGIEKLDDNLSFGDAVIYSNPSNNLQIGPGVKTINSNYLYGKGTIETISVDEDNGIFVYKDGMLIYNDQLILVDGAHSTITINDDSKINVLRSHSLKNGSVTDLIIDKGGLKVESGVINGSTSLKNIFITDPSSCSFDATSFTGANSDLTFFIPHTTQEDLKHILNSVGSVMLGYGAGGNVAYLPYMVGNQVVSVSDCRYEQGVFSALVDITGGYTLNDVTLSTIDGIDVLIEDSRVKFESTSDVFITMEIKGRQSGDVVFVTFDGNGGQSNGNSTIILSISKGLTIVDSEIPTFTKDSSDFVKWNKDGATYDFSSVVTGDLTLVATWTSRNPTITINTLAGDVYHNGAKVKEIKDIGNSDITLTFEGYAGYEPIEWVYVVDNNIVTEPIGNNLVLRNITSDVTVSVSYRYFSTSSGLVPVVNRGMPTNSELASTVMAWETGGTVDKSEMAWRGHSSVPLVVDGYTYVRVGDGLYKFETDTGYVVKRVTSYSTNAFYHQIGYGNGMIVDYYTNKVYDVNLNHLFTLDRKVSGLEYSNGYFYTSGTDLYRFPADCNKARDGIMNLEKVGSFDKAVYSSYGFSISVFNKGYLYRIYADGSERGITVLCIDDKASEFGKSSHIKVTSLDFMYLDDGWLSIHKDVLYLGGYTNGLFGAVAAQKDDALASIKVSGMSMVEQNPYIFEGKRTFVSQFVVSGGVGYIVAGGTLYAFNMNDDGTLGELLGKESMVYSHGSITIESSHATEENGHLTYVYMIPYDPQNVSLAIVECYRQDGGFIMNKLLDNHFTKDYNSQAVRSGLEGQMIWYNDSGHVFGYIVPEKNPYYFFLNDGSNAGWYVSYGKNMYEAAKSLDAGLLSINDNYEVSRLFGKPVSGATISAVHSPINTVMKYEWSVVDSFNNRSYDTDHYVIIVANGINVQKGDTFSYVGGTYSFQENIGFDDSGNSLRHLVGMRMIPGTNVSTVKFVADGKEFTSIGINGTSIGDIPRMVKEGYMPVWKCDDTAVNILNERYSSSKEYVLDWVKIDQTISSTFSKSTSSVSVVLDNVKEDDVSTMRVVLNIIYSDNSMDRKEMSELQLQGGKILVNFQCDLNKTVKDAAAYAEYNGIPLCIDYPVLA